MTANELREAMGLQSHEEELQSWINRIEDSIRQVASNGGRFYVSKIHPTALGSGITEYFLKNGFHVNHYVSPFEEVEIRW